ncbi:GAF domain-containing protein [Kribbella pratensis]|uniref:GAF domain-containing protein n=1 Tax=Kribbella pratensis TaxID=2512112 RepID=UPI0010657FE0|nr:GAF domain-containing protein [Kribbella pratensis]
MQEVVQFVLHAVGCRYASVALVTGEGRPEIVASSDARIAESRWSPRWAEQVQSAGIRSAVHLPVVVASSPQAVLSLSSDKPDGFTVDDVAVAHILARHASVAIATARRDENLAYAIDARKLVDKRWAF